MKGLLIGLSFAIRGVFETLAAVSALPFTLAWHREGLPSCGMVYYLVNIGVGTIAIVVYGHTAKKYRYRERDEPDLIRRYVEDYYSKIP